MPGQIAFPAHSSTTKFQLLATPPSPIRPRGTESPRAPFRPEFGAPRHPLSIGLGAPRHLLRERGTLERRITHFVWRLPAVLLRGNGQYPKTPSPTSPYRKKGMATAAAVSTCLPWLLPLPTSSSGRWELRAFPAIILPPPRQFTYVEIMNTRESLWPLNVVPPYAFLPPGPPPI